MKLIKIIGLLILLTIIVDFVETTYYLNEYGFDKELNPNITNNKKLIETFLLRFVITAFALTFLYLLIKNDLLIKNTLKYCIELTLMFVLGFNTAIVVKNLVIILL